MHLWILLTIHLLICKLTGRIVIAEERQKRTVGHYPACPRGCESCSQANGCIRCRHRLYLLLERHGMVQRGRCTHECPHGYYGMRRQRYSMCYRCQIPNCLACFNSRYCTRCASPFISYRGRCIESCPDGLHYANYSKDCRLVVDCMVGPWAPWGACTRDGQHCGYRYGVTTRTRLILDHPSDNGLSCPALAENRCCVMQMRQCADLIHNNSDLTREKRKNLLGKRKKRRRRKKKRKSKRKRKGKKGKKRRRRIKNKRRNRLRKRRKQKQRLQKRAWKDFCQLQHTYNDISVLSNG